MMNVVQLLRGSVVRNPHHPCLQFKEDGAYQSWNYGQVWDEITRFASSLKVRGIGRGDKVGIMADSSQKWVVCDFAVMSLGAVVVPIYPSVTPEQAAFILRNADVKCLIGGSWELLEGLEHLLPDSVGFAVCLSGRIRPFPIPVESFDEIQAEMPVSFDLGEISSITPDTIATIVHTSGTSGTPKGVVLTHGNLVSNVEACLSVLTVEPSDVSLSYLPLSHIFERTVGHFCILTAGGTIAYAENLETISQNVQEVRPTVLVTVPRLLEKVYAGILQKIEERPALLSRFVMGCLESQEGTWKHSVANRMVYKKLKSGLGGNLRAVVSGGAGLSGEISLFYQRAGIPVCEGYGMTETAPVIAVNPLDDIQAGTVGRPLPNVQVQIATDGELLVKGPNVMSGYYGNQEATAEIFDEEGWLHTGDIAEFVDGYIRIVERKKNLLVLATGKNVAPYPIENAITLSPFILDAVLVGDGRKYVSCLIVPDFGAIVGKLELPLETDYGALTSNLEVRRLLQHEIREAVKGFAEFEQPKRAVLLKTPFSIESGDLTPTLKVKAKVVLQRYQTEINDMYDGIRYLDVFGAPEAGLGDEPPFDNQTGTPSGRVTEAVGNLPATPRKATRSHRGLWWAAGVAAVLLVLFGGLAQAKKLPPSLNLLATLKQVHHNNNEINKANNGIVSKMGRVEQLSGKSSTLAGQLKTLSTGLNQQNTSLATLKQLSQEEIGLSQQFASLAGSMNQDLGNVSQTTQAQSAAASKMNQLATNINRTAANLAQTNQQIAGKLSQATTKTQLVSSEVP